MQDLRWAVRSLRRSAGFTCLALATLALGIGTTTTAYAVFDTVLLRPLPYRDADRLVLIRERAADHSVMPPSYPNFVDWRNRARAFDGVASAMFPFSSTVWPSVAGTTPLRETVTGVSRGFFATLGVRPAAGREFTAAEDALNGPPVIMVSYEFWQSALGGRRPLGTMRWVDRVVTVVGALPPDFQFVTPADLYFPHEQQPGTVRNADNYLVVGRLETNVSLAAAQSDMTNLSRALYKTFGTETAAVDADVLPLRDCVVSDVRAVLSVVVGAAAMVLLIVCVNLLSAQLARAWARDREIAVRGALGAAAIEASDRRHCSPAPASTIVRT